MISIFFKFYAMAGTTHTHTRARARARFLMFFSKIYGYILFYNNFQF